MAATESWSVGEVEAWNAIANDVHRQTIDLLNTLFLARQAIYGDGDTFAAGPVIQGAMAAILEFAMDGTALSDDEIRQDLVQNIDSLTPEIRGLLFSVTPAAGRA